MYPCVCVDCNKIAGNVRKLKELCQSYGIEILGVTKAFGGVPEIARIFTENGLRKLGDSRIENLKNYENLLCEKWLIRMPAVSEAAEVIRYADVSLNSEISTLVVLNREALSQGKKHKVVIMLDLGDLREGYVEEKELAECIAYVKQASGLELYGIGTNLTCFSFVIPDEGKMKKLVEFSRKYQTGAIVSGGNSATLRLMLEGKIPRGMNSLRLGEALLFGREREHYTYFPGTTNDAFLLKAEIIECKEKPSLPWGTIGRDSYGKRPKFKDDGERCQVICSIGKEDIDPETMWPLDENIKILGASSDHLMVDVTASAKHYKAGDILEFRLGYFATMRAFTSKYIEKDYIGG